jgi:hypothetical protein
VVPSEVSQRIQKWARIVRRRFDPFDATSTTMLAAPKIIRRVEIARRRCRLVDERECIVEKPIDVLVRDASAHAWFQSDRTIVPSPKQISNSEQVGVSPESATVDVSKRCGTQTDKVAEMVCNNWCVSWQGRFRFEWGMHCITITPLTRFKPLTDNHT